MSVSVDPTEAVTLTRDLVRFNTTNPPGDETPVIRLLEERLRADGFETVTIPYLVGENRSQLVARLRGSGERPGLLFSGHVDVVPPATCRGRWRRSAARSGKVVSTVAARAT